MESSVMLKVENFRAIGKAEIKLDGITVVAGVNGCGKSTISKLLYNAFKISNDFKTTLDEYIKLYKAKYISLERNLKQSLLRKNSRNLWIESLELLDLINDNDKEDNFYHSRFEKLSEFKKDIPQKENKSEINRFWEICYEEISHFDEHIKNELVRVKNTHNWLDMINFLAFYLNWIQNKQRKDLEIQPIHYFNDEIMDIFHVNYLPTKLEIWEKSVPIVSTENENMMTPFEIDNVIYIDTPMSFNHYEEEHWKDLNEKLKERPKLNSQPKLIQEIDDLMKNQVFTDGAKIQFDELSENFTLRLKNGVELDLNDSATGMKAFAMLDRLVRNGSINNKTLLILDEPEAHLHPQWVVELGRLLTLINKHIGAKVFVATHSPDMVQALRYIPNKEKIGERVNFYLAEFNHETGLFDYQDLQGKVGKIFKSFNKSMDKLERYGDR